MNKFNIRYLTPQEQALFGSSTEKRYHDLPHTPIIVQDREVTLRECDIIRQKKGETDCYGFFWKNYSLGSMHLEKLNEKGETIQDPTLVKIIEHDSGIPVQEFPFKRQTPQINLRETPDGS